MSFKSGDMVQIIAPPAPYRCCIGNRSLVGMFATVERMRCDAHPIGGQYWDVRFADNLIGGVAQACLRKVPPDPGRELVEWDWRELITKQPECV